MVNVTQGTMRNIRIELFTHMESLPISYFDTHPHGDIMSVVYQRRGYPSPDDQPEHPPAGVSSVITILSVFVSMCILDIPMTVLTICMVA